MSSTDEGFKNAVIFALIGVGIGWIVWTPRGQDLAKKCADEGFRRAGRYLAGLSDSGCPYTKKPTSIGDENIEQVARRPRRKRY